GMRISERNLVFAPCGLEMQRDAERRGSPLGRDNEISEAVAVFTVGLDLVHNRAVNFEPADGLESVRRRQRNPQMQRRAARWQRGHGHLVGELKLARRYKRRRAGLRGNTRK